MKNDLDDIQDRYDDGDTKAFNYIPDLIQEIRELRALVPTRPPKPASPEPLSIDDRLTAVESRLADLEQWRENERERAAGDDW
jgi:hypothetical protein